MIATSSILLLDFDFNTRAPCLSSNIWLSHGSPISLPGLPLSKPLPGFFPWALLPCAAWFVLGVSVATASNPGNPELIAFFAHLLAILTGPGIYHCELLPPQTAPTRPHPGLVHLIPHPVPTPTLLEKQALAWWASP